MKKRIVFTVISLALTACASSAPPQSAPAVASPTSGVLLEAHGRTGDTTASFSASGRWDLSWSFQCTVGAPPDDHLLTPFVILVLLDDSALDDVLSHGDDPAYAASRYQMLRDAVIDSVGPDDTRPDGSGVDHAFPAGTYRLRIPDDCDWHVTVTSAT